VDGAFLRYIVDFPIEITGSICKHSYKYFLLLVDFLLFIAVSSIFYEKAYLFPYFYSLKPASKNVKIFDVLSMAGR
jgi:hypothetical protein